MKPGEKLALLALLLASFLAYGRVADHGFLNFDDGSYITENPFVRQGLTAEGVAWAFTEFHSSNWHPLTWLSHMLDCELFGLDAGAHHLMGVSLHTLAGLFAFLALRRLSGSVGVALVVAGIFLLHPQRVESVAWAAERKDVLSALFFFLTLFLYGGYAKAPSPGRLAGLCLAFGLGLLAKPMLVTLPFVLLLLDLWPLGRLRPAELGAGADEDSSPVGQPVRPLALVTEKLPLFLMVAVSCTVTVFAQRAGGAIRSLEALPFASRLANTAEAYVAYVQKALVPSPLAFFYPHPAFLDPGGYDPWRASVFVSALLLVVATVVALRLRQSRPWWLMGWLWYLGMMVPVIGLVQVGSQWMADRYAYLPLVGLTWNVVYEVGLLAGRGSAWRRGLQVAAVAILATYAGLTHQQSKTWRNNRTLYSHALRVTDDNYLAMNNLGFVVQTEARDATGAEQAELLRQARLLYENAIELAPGLPDAHNNLGGIELIEGRLGEARRHFERALELRPTFLDPRLNLGKVKELQGDAAGAAEEWLRAAREHPLEVNAQLMAAGALRDSRRLEESAEALERALARAGDRIDSRVQLARTYLLLGREREAHEQLLRAEAADPRGIEVRTTRVLLQALAKDPSLRAHDEALAQGRALLDEAEDAGRNPYFQRRALAAALAAAGRFDEAVSQLNRALLSAPPQESWILQDELDAYRSRRLPRR